MSGGFDLLARLEARNTAPAPAPNTDNENATAGSFCGARGGFDLLARLEKRDDDPTLPAVQTNGAAQALQAANARMQLLNGSDDQPRAGNDMKNAVNATSSTESGSTLNGGGRSAKMTPVLAPAPVPVVLAEEEKEGASSALEAALARLNAMKKGSCLGKPDPNDAADQEEKAEPTPAPPSTAILEAQARARRREERKQRRAEEKAQAAKTEADKLAEANEVISSAEKPKLVVIPPAATTAASSGLLAPTQNAPTSSVTSSTIAPAKITPPSVTAAEMAAKTAGGPPYLPHNQSSLLGDQGSSPRTVSSSEKVDADAAASPPPPPPASPPAPEVRAAHRSAAEEMMASGKITEQEYEQLLAAEKR